MQPRSWYWAMVLHGSRTTIQLPSLEHGSTTSRWASGRQPILVNAAPRHHIPVYPVDVNPCTLEGEGNGEITQWLTGLRNIVCEAQWVVVTEVYFECSI